MLVNTAGDNGGGRIEHRASGAWEPGWPLPGLDWLGLAGLGWARLASVRKLSLLFWNPPRALEALPLPDA